MFAVIVAVGELLNVVVANPISCNMLNGNVNNIMNLNRNRIKYLDKNLAAFEFGMAQDLMSLMLHTQSLGISTDEFVAWVQHRQHEIKIGMEKFAEANRQKPSFVCPDCGSAAHLSEVNKSSGDQVGGGYKTQLFCRNMIKCGYVEYSADSLSDWSRKLKYFKSGLKTKMVVTGGKET